VHESIECKVIVIWYSYCYILLARACGTKVYIEDDRDVDVWMQLKTFTHNNGDH